MLRMFALILAAVIAMLCTILPRGAETEPTLPNAPELHVDEGSYRGAWVTSDALGIEFFLPEGWTGGDAQDDYAARSADGAVELRVSRLGDLGRDESLADWGAANLTDRQFEPAVANGGDALLSRADDGFAVAVPCGSGVYLFDFTRGSEAALSEDRALRIAGSVSQDW